MKKKILPILSMVLTLVMVVVGYANGSNQANAEILPLPTTAPVTTLSPSPTYSPYVTYAPTATTVPTTVTTTSATTKSAVTSSAVTNSALNYLNIGKSTVTGLKAKAKFVKKKKINYVPAINLSWEKNQYAEGYVIFKATGKSFKQYKIIEGGDKLKFTDKKVSMNTKYSYKVCAYALDTNKIEYDSADSDIVTANPGKKLMKPNFTIKTGGGNLVITFKKVQGSTFQTQYKYNDQKKWTTLNINKGKVKKTIKVRLNAHGFKLRIRTYMKSGKKKLYSAWVSSKTI